MAVHQFVGELKSTLFRCLNALLPIEPPYAIVDVPNHANVGDSAIVPVNWRGSTRLARLLPVTCATPTPTVSPIYGKVRSLFDTLTRGTPGVVYCADWFEADRAPQVLAGDTDSERASA